MKTIVEMYRDIMKPGGVMRNLNAILALISIFFIFIPGGWGHGLWAFCLGGSIVDTIGKLHRRDNPDKGAQVHMARFLKFLLEGRYEHHPSETDGGIPFDVEQALEQYQEQLQK